jgi:S1-C subfamily serine protease
MERNEEVETHGHTSGWAPSSGEPAWAGADPLTGGPGSGPVLPAPPLRRDQSDPDVLGDSGGVGGRRGSGGGFGSPGGFGGSGGRRRRPGRLLRGWAIGATAVALVAGGYGVRAITAPETSTATTVSTSGTIVSTQGTEDLAALVKQVEPSIVKVTSQIQRQTGFLGSTQSGEAVGTGFVVGSDGLILTNYHVVEGASSISVTLSDGHSYAATLVKFDSSGDLAVLKIGATGLTALPLGDSSTVQAGQSVIAIGYALDLQGSPTVTTGIVSSTSRTVQALDDNGTNGPVLRTYKDALQISAAINSGNSGGPLLDYNGKVIGISTAGVQGANNIGFAIPIDHAKSLIASA